MKNKKFKTMFFTLLAMTGVFLISGTAINSNTLPIVAEAISENVSQVETLKSDFTVFEAKFDENFDKRGNAFLGTGITCSAYRYNKEIREPGVLHLLPKEYTGEITITGIDPLPGQFFNTDPIKGITQIKVTARGSGCLRWDDRLDFQHGFYKNFTSQTTITFTNNFPAFFKVETYQQKSLALKSVEITRDSCLGTVNLDLAKVGYDAYRLQGPYWGIDEYDTGAQVNYDITYNPNHEGYHTNTVKIYKKSDKYTDLFDCAQQLHIFTNQSKSLFCSNPAGYNRNDGYVKAFGDAYIKDQRYYEYDVMLSKGQTNRGTGRLVVFTEGVNSPGYGKAPTNQPLVVFTDDHYFTFVECYWHRTNGKPIWSRRFSTEVPITGSVWSPATTLLYNSKEAGTGTPDSPTPEPKNLKIYTDPITNIGLNENLQFKSELTGDDGTIEYYSRNTYVASIDKNTGLLTAKDYGNAIIYAKARPANGGQTIFSNEITVSVKKSMQLMIMGDHHKDYYEGQTFNPEGLVMFIKYDDGKVDYIDGKTCSWVDPETGQERLRLGQTQIKCIYKEGVTRTLSGLNVKEALAPTSMQVNYTSGDIELNRPIELGVTVFPEGASDEVTWELKFIRYVNGAKLEGNILTPLANRCVMEVIATSTKNHLQASSYFEVFENPTYSQVFSTKSLQNGEYLIANDYYTYDPSLESKSNSVYRHNANIPSTKIKITKAPIPGNYYYMQRSDNDLYLDFSANNIGIQKNSTIPVANRIELTNNNWCIYSKDASYSFQFNQKTKQFVKAESGTLAPIQLFTEISTLSNIYFVCKSFVEGYMHLDTYNSNNGWCSDEEHHYYQDAKAAFLRFDNEQRKMFSTSTSYAQAWERLNAWAKANGETIQLDAEGNVTYNANKSIIIAERDNDEMITIICVVALSAFTFIGFCFLKTRKRKNY